MDAGEHPTSETTLVPVTPHGSSSHPLLSSNTPPPLSSLSGIHFGEGSDPLAEALFAEDGDSCNGSELGTVQGDEIDQAYLQQLMAPDPDYQYTTAFDALPARRQARERDVLEGPFAYAMREMEGAGGLGGSGAGVGGPPRWDPMSREPGVEGSEWSLLGAFPKKADRIYQDYVENKKELAEVTKEYLRRQHDLLDQDAIAIEQPIKETEVYDVIPVRGKNENWDCETILTTYSTTCNRPAVIVPERQMRPTRRTRVRPPNQTIPTPLSTQDEVREKRAASRAPLSAFRDFSQLPEDTSLEAELANDSTLSIPSEVPVRDPNESAAEKKERRKMVKEIQAQRRQMKRKVTLLYRAEGIRQRQTQKQNSMLL